MKKIMFDAIKELGIKYSLEADKCLTNGDVFGATTWMNKKEGLSDFMLLLGEKIQEEGLEVELSDFTLQTN